MKLRPMIAMMAVLLALGACGDGGAGPGDELAIGTFEASITGGFTATLTGQARSGATQGYYILAMEDNDAQGLPGAILLLRSGERPAPGTYTVSDDIFSTSAFLAIAATGEDESQNGLSFEASSGSVTITESTPSNVRGTFELNGTGFRDLTPSNEFQVRITGRFNTSDQDP